MTNPGEVDVRMKEMWEVKLPLKIKIFLWMLWQDRVQTGEQHKRRKGKGENCKYRGKLETRNHLFFNCHITQMVWVWVRVSLRWVKRPTSDMMIADEVSTSRSVAYAVIASIVWSVWKTRNDWVFNGNLIKSPKQITHKIMGFLSQWRKMLKKKDQLLMDDVILKLQEGLRAW